MRPQIIPFRARHLKEILPDATEEQQWMALLAQESGPGYTAFLFGKAVGAAGVSIQKPGLGEAWAIFTPLLKFYPLWLHRECKARLAKIQGIQVYAQAENCNEKWLMRLGFKKVQREKVKLERELDSGNELYLWRG